MKVLLISCYFPPEIGSGPHLPYELGESLVHKGHEVTVVTGFPRYNVPVLPECYRDKTLVREKTGGMTVLRMRAPIPYGKGTIDRGLFHLLSPLLLAVRSLPLERPDVVYSFTPPLPMGIVARAVASRFRVPCLVNVQDLFPQNAIDLGLLRNTTIIRLFQAMDAAFIDGRTASPSCPTETAIASSPAASPRPSPHRLQLGRHGVDSPRRTAQCLSPRKRDR